MSWRHRVPTRIRQVLAVFLTASLCGQPQLALAFESSDLGWHVFTNVEVYRSQNDHGLITVQGLTAAGFSLECAQEAASANALVDELETESVQVPLTDIIVGNPKLATYAPAHHFDRNDGQHSHVFPQAHLNAFTSGLFSLRGEWLTAVHATQRGPALESFGRLVHALQDFYSHSNYVDLQAEQILIDSLLIPRFRSFQHSGIRSLEFT